MKMRTFVRHVRSVRFTQKGLKYIEGSNEK